MGRRTSACRKELEQPRRRTQVQALETLRDHRYVLISNSCYAHHLTQKLVVATRKPSNTCQPVYKQALELVNGHRAGLVSLLHEHLVFLPPQNTGHRVIMRLNLLFVLFAAASSALCAPLLDSPESRSGAIISNIKHAPGMLEYVPASPIRCHRSPSTP